MAARTEVLKLAITPTNMLIKGNGCYKLNINIHETPAYTINIALYIIPFMKNLLTSSSFRIFISLVVIIRYQLLAKPYKHHSDFGEPIKPLCNLSDALYLTVPDMTLISVITKQVNCYASWNHQIMNSVHIV